MSSCKFQGVQELGMCAKSLQSCPTLWLLCPWGFSKQEHWSGVPRSPPRDLSNPGIKPTSLMSPALASLPWMPSEKPHNLITFQRPHLQNIITLGIRLDFNLGIWQGQGDEQLKYSFSLQLYTKYKYTNIYIECLYMCVYIYNTYLYTHVKINLIKSLWKYFETHVLAKC